MLPCNETWFATDSGSNLPSYIAQIRHVFLSLSKEAMDSTSAREIVAELRNEGHIEEEVRGTIRLTQRGYRAFQNDPPPYSYRTCTTPKAVTPSISAPRSDEHPCGERM